MPEQQRAQLPPAGTLMADSSRNDRIGEFRGASGPYWSLRPIGGGPEWETVLEHCRPATRDERLRARTAYENARSRGEVA